jgi:pyrimidine deaminase RibD-like protein
MSKTQFYLSQCADAASKSPMCFTLGAVLVKGGKVISSGYNHHRPHYDGAEVRTRGHRKPVSMHAEMHAIFSLTGMSPSFRKQRQGAARTGTGAGAVASQLQTPCFAAPPTPPTPPPRSSSSSSFKGKAPLATCEGHPHRVQWVAGAGSGLPLANWKAALSPIIVF